MIRPFTAAMALFASALASPLVAQSGLPPAPYAYQQLDDPRQEAAAKALMEELRCLVCQGQSIADSDAPLAGDMRSEVRERIAAGESPAAIREWLVQRYGNWVTYDPPFGPDTAVLFILPVLAFLLGGGLVLSRFRKGEPNDARDVEGGQGA